MNARILFVDDDPNLIEALKRTLRKQPYEIFTALSAKDGLKLLDEQEIDVVVSDNDMPGMSGVEFLTRVRSAHPGTVRVMLTGRASLQSAIEAINEGEIFRFIVKPCDAGSLNRVLVQGVKHRKLLRYARKLLDKSRTQSRIIRNLETENPGITHLQTDGDGAIVIDDDIDTSLADLLERMDD